ncbi:MAG: class D sortase [Acidobacteria bacterium]|nr:class D sortase [Acidobacteriota bacterium]
MKIRIHGPGSARSWAALAATHFLALLAGVGIATAPRLLLRDSPAAAPAPAAAPRAAAVPPAIAPVPEPHPPAPEPPPARGTLLGRFAVPRLGLSYDVLEGTDDETLDRGLGHIEGTGLIGSPGNIGIAGHRNTHFRKLEWIRTGDEFILSASGGEFRYRVVWAQLHPPEAVQVLDPSQGPAVTLVTCFPFEDVGSAPLRFVVRAVPAEETRTRLQAPAPPPAPAIHADE